MEPAPDVGTVLIIVDPATADDDVGVEGAGTAADDGDDVDVAHAVPITHRLAAMRLTASSVYERSC